MLNRKLALAALVCLTPLARADDPVPADLASPYRLLEAPTRQDGLATHLIDPSDSLYRNTGIEWGGNVEMGYTYNFDNPAARQNAFRVFDIMDNRGVFNQLDLFVERQVDYHKNK